MALAVFLGAISTQWPQSWSQWLLLGLATALGAIAPQTRFSGRVWQRALDFVRRWWPARGVRLRRWLLYAIALVLAAGFGRSLVAGGATVVDAVDERLFGCRPPTTLRVLTVPEGFGGARDLVGAYTADLARRNGGCPEVRMYVYAQPAARALAALRGGWGVDSLAALGPRPDLWLPGSSEYLPVDPDGASNGLLRDAQSTVVATTPVVLGVPAVRPEFAADGEPLTWEQMWDRAVAEKLPIVRPDPAVSATGTYATVALYARGPDWQRKLDDPAFQPLLADDNTARLVERRIADALDDGGFPLGDADDLICARLMAAGGSDAALTLTEQQLVRFNDGLPVGDGCPSTRPAEGQRLRAFYPTDTLGLEYPVVDLAWADRSASRAERVAGFRDWLVTPDGKRALTAVGLRPPDWSVHHPFVDALGARTDVTYWRDGISERSLDDVMRLRSLTQRPGRVLVLLDTSGSMGQPAGAAGGSRLEMAKRSVTIMSTLVGGKDEFALWTFPAGSAGHRQITPVGRAGEPAGDWTNTLAGITPVGSTPLYATIDAAVSAVGPSTRELATAVVAITDGRDEGSEVDVAGVVRRVDTSEVRVFVVSIGDAGCTAPGLDDITGGSGGSCHQVDPEGLDARLRDLAGLLWTGRET